MIRKLKSGKYRLYSRKKNPKTNKRRNLGTFESLEAAQAWAEADPYVAAAVYDNVKVRPYKKVF